MSLILGRQGGIAKPLKKRTVGQSNIAHVYDGVNHIWPTSVIHFSDFRRDVNGKANAGLTLGIIGTALGAWALFGNRRSSVLGGAGGGMLGDGSTNINVLGATAGSGSGAPTAFQAWEKSCEDTLALQGGLYQWALTQQNQRFEDRERLNSELFGVYIDGRNRTDALIEKNNTDHFNLYKYTRDADDDIRKELSDLKAELAVTKAIRPYQDKLIQCEMEKMFTAGINYTDRKSSLFYLSKF